MSHEKTFNKLLAALKAFREDVPDNRHAETAGVDPYHIELEVLTQIDSAIHEGNAAGSSPPLVKSPHAQEVERLRRELADVLDAIGLLVGKLPNDHAHRMAELRMRVDVIDSRLGPAGSPYSHEMDE
jgi:hypothetical protein